MPLNVLVAPSGLKECLEAEAVAAAVASGVRKALRSAEVMELPLADGGEGTARTLARVTGGTVHDCTVTGPTGAPIESHFAVLGGDGPPTAVVELAAAAGLRHVPAGERDPLRTTSRGVGELIAAALDHKVARILVGCGDSGVNDGGAGLARALGARFLDSAGEEIAEGGQGLDRLARIDRSGLDPRLAQVEVEVACNMANVLTGPNGVARAFGPQKGASPDDVERLAAGLDRFADVAERDCGVDVRDIPGGGASGGVGAGLHALLGARLSSRFDLLFPYFEVGRWVEWADLIVTGEGAVDRKSAGGKIPAELGRLGRAAGKPVVLLAGSLDEGAEAVLGEGVCAFFSLADRPQSLAECMERAEQQLECLAEHVVRTFAAGAKIPADG